MAAALANLIGLGGNHNYALVSVPFYYVFCVLPHSYALTVSTNGDLSKLDNTNPRVGVWADKVKSQVSPATYARYLRAESAHYNQLESFAYFSVAILAGTMARLPNEELNGYLVGFGALRAIYLMLYINTSRYAAATWVRSSVWVAALSWSLNMIYRSGKLLM